MLRCGKILAILIFLPLFASTISSYAEEEIEDLIDLFESKSKIIAIIEGKKTVSFELQPKEKVLWSGSEGYLGAFLTNRHFFVISTSSPVWHALPLKSDESEKGAASLSPHIALLVTGIRIIGFDASSNRFIEVQLPIHDELIAAEVEKYVAVVITSSRAFGLAAETSTFNEIHFRVGESMEAMKLSPSKATVRTSHRLLTYEANGATWNEHQL